MTIEDLISRVFAARDAAHLSHWITQSFAQHEALGEFYEGVTEQVDTIVEAYQGYFGRIGTVGLTPLSYDDIASFIADEAKAICEARSEIARGNAAIENLIDELCAVYFKTFYKLANLK